MEVVIWLAVWLTVSAIIAAIGAEMRDLDDGYDPDNSDVQATFMISLLWPILVVALVPFLAVAGFYIGVAKLIRPVVRKIRGGRHV